MLENPCRDEALLSLSQKLVRQGYRFVTPTPATHHRVLARKVGRAALSLTDVFGWSLPFGADLIQRDLLEDMRAAGVLDDSSVAYRSRVRVSTVRDRVYIHSAYPTSGADAVFLGPDSYRFANLIADELEARPPAPNARIVDIGVGAGVGAVTAASCCPSANIVGTDINPQALRLTRVNAAAAGVSIEAIETSGLDGVFGTFDVVLLNPPYLMDSKARIYRHGGAMHGAQLPFDLTVAALGKLSPGGRLILYSGTAIVEGHDGLRAALVQAAADNGVTLRYREIDPDVFSEELDTPLYATVERIALISAIFTHQA